MRNSNRYFNQKFIALILIILGSIGLTYVGIINELYYTITVLIAYGIFAGFEALSFGKDGMTMNR